MKGPKKTKTKNEKQKTKTKNENQKREKENRKKNKGKSGIRDSNPRPSAWEANALPTELIPHG